MTIPSEHMQALTYQGLPGYKSPRIRSVKRPVPGPGQVLIRVAASSLNPIDWKLRSGVLGFLTPMVRLGAIPGFDFVGQVIASGEDSMPFAVGDRVFGMLNFRTLGSLAEYLVADVTDIAFAGDSLDNPTLAGLPLAGMTALQSIRDLGQIHAGQNLLVIGASGGVGHLAVQMGKRLGARVTAITSTRNVDFVKGLGADEVVDYTLGEGVKGRFDVIFDAVVSKPYSQWKELLSAAGTYVSVLPTAELIIRSQISRNSSGKKVRLIGVKPSRSDLEWLRDLAVNGRLNVNVDSNFGLAEGATALLRSQTGRARGKIIVSL